MNDRETVTKRLYEFDSMDNWQPLAEFLAEIAEVTAGVPEEFRDEIVLVGERGYEDYVPRYRIEYTRPETDAEMAAREARSREYAEDAKRRELEQLARLKAKYGQ
jgi:hypothetical protein